MSAAAPGSGASGSSGTAQSLAPTSGSAGLSGASGGSGVTLSSGNGGNGGAGGAGGNGGTPGPGGPGGGGALGGNGLPGMVKLHGSVILASQARVRGNNMPGFLPDQNGAYTMISNMNFGSGHTNAPVSLTSSLVAGYTTHDELLKGSNAYTGVKSPMLPNLVGGPATYGWCLPNYWNSGVESPAFSTDNNLEYRVFRNAYGTSVFEGFDQLVIRNTNTSGAPATGVSIQVGTVPDALIDGVGGTAGELAAGQTWTTTIPAGVTVVVPGASGTDGQGNGPVAAFTATPTSGGRPLVVQFGDQSSPGSYPITNWNWDFGDGATSTLQNPAHAYTVTGAYTVKLSVTTQIGGSLRMQTNYITITDPVPPSADFAAGPVAGTRDLAVQFGDLSVPGSAPIQSWAWNFGDGGTSTTKSPSHTYTAAGAFAVSLTVTSSVGSDTETKTGYVTVSDPGGPVASFTANPVSGFAPLDVQFVDQSAEGSSPITAWSWNFGDTGTSTDPSPMHTYATPGAYNVTLTVTTAAGSNTLTKPSYIGVGAPGGPTADFTGSPLAGTAPLAVQFADVSMAGSEPITTWSWTFGDGGVSNVQAPTHTYMTSGAFEVSLTVTTAAGGHTTSRPGYVVVGAATGPTAAFAASATAGLTPYNVQFVDQSTPGTSPITAWAWNFGDGFTSALPSPSHVYTTPGTYTVSLNVTTAVGTDPEVKSGYVVVSAPTLPMADFTANPLTGSVPLRIQFASKSSGGSGAIASWSWNFGDGTPVSTEQAPLHTYATPGFYDVELTITTGYGSDAEHKSLYVNATGAVVMPEAAFEGAPTVGPVPLTVQFTDHSVPGSANITAWAWDFGDGQSSTLANPSHTYDSAGSYPVTLRVTTSAGNDTTTVANYIVVEDGSTGVPVAGAAGLMALAVALGAAGVAKASRRRTK